MPPPDDKKISQAKSTGKPGGNTPPEKLGKKPPGAEDMPKVADQSEAKPKKIEKPENELFKFEMQYVNGGFNNGINVKPDKNGKLNIEISIYGGGRRKTLSVGPASQNVKKLLNAYEIAATGGQSDEHITVELQRYCKEIEEKLSMKIIDILSEMDEKVKAVIKETMEKS
jgi:hypothetical protein